MLRLTWLLQASFREVYIFSALKPVLKQKCLWGYFLWDQAILYMESLNETVTGSYESFHSAVMNTSLHLCCPQTTSKKKIPAILFVSPLTKSHSSANPSAVITVKMFIILYPTKAEQEHHHCIPQFRHFVESPCWTEFFPIEKNQLLVQDHSTEQIILLANKWGAERRNKDVGCRNKLRN